MFRFFSTEAEKLSPKDTSEESGEIVAKKGSKSV